MHNPILELAAMTLKIPKGNAVLHRDNNRLVVKQVRQILDYRCKLIGFHSEDHQVLRSRFCERGACIDVPDNMLNAICHRQPHAPAANCFQIRISSDQGDIFARLGKLHTDITTNRTCTHNTNLHRMIPFEDNLDKTMNP